MQEEKKVTVECHFLEMTQGHVLVDSKNPLLQRQYKADDYFIIVILK